MDEKDINDIFDGQTLDNDGDSEFEKDLGVDPMRMLELHARLYFNMQRPDKGDQNIKDMFRKYNDIMDGYTTQEIRVIMVVMVGSMISESLRADHMDKVNSKVLQMIWDGKLAPDRD